MVVIAQAVQQCSQVQRWLCPSLRSLDNNARAMAFVLGFMFAALPLSASALSTADFTNSGSVQSSPDQFEPELVNNQSSVLVLPKGIEITKTADSSALATPTSAGDTITYTIELSNTGLLDLTNVVLTDSIIPASDLSLVSGDIDSDNELDASEVWEFTGTYQVTQADIDSNGGGDGDIDNTATVTTAELPPAEASVEVPITQAPLFEVTKAVDNVSIASPGTLNYTITVSNTGNVTLNNVAPVDLLPDGSVAVLTGPLSDSGIAGSLDVGEVWTYTTSYAAIQADIDAGAALINTVSVTTDETGADSVDAEERLRTLAMSVLTGLPLLIPCLTVQQVR